MKKILLLILLAVQTLMSTELKHITIGNQDFMLTVEAIYGSKDKGF